MIEHHVKRIYAFGVKWLGAFLPLQQQSTCTIISRGKRNLMHCASALSVSLSAEAEAAIIETIV